MIRLLESLCPMFTRVLVFLCLIFTLDLQAATIEVVSIPSAKMGKSISATIILPDAYAEGDGRFPVTYLLHGAGDTHAKWNAETDVAALADEYGMMMVCPDGGRTSWFIDSPIDPSYQYETHVADECVQFVDAHYRTRADRSSRAICGLSMGGHGALFLAIRHPNTFGTSVALSGGLDLRPFPENWDIKKRIGSITDYPENWEKYSVINLAKQLKDTELNISIDCGRNDFFLKVNRALHQQLLDDGISHVYQEHSGGHGWDYWRAAIKRQIPYVATQFKNASLDQCAIE
jgi:S-formylglutathione hydrolase FrmB